MKKNNPEYILDLIKETIGISGRSLSVSIHEPDFNDSNAWLYVKECIDSNWVSSQGNWVRKFENQICSFTGSPEAIAVTNGTDALRLAFHLLGVSINEEVIVPSMTFIGTCNAISHLGAVPHFIDVERLTLGMDPKALENRLKKIAISKKGKVYNKETGRRISAICPVHIFGNPANTFALKNIADSWSLPVVEDAAEALGSFISNTHCGLVGDIGILSFNGNKIITTGGGGILLIKDKQLASKARHLSTTAKIEHPWDFFHDEVGWNDRMPNINAALGVSQLENINEKLSLKKKLFLRYCEFFEDISEIDIFKSKLPNCSSNNWLITLMIKFPDLIKTNEFRNKLLDISHKNGIFLRPIWRPIHTLPMYINSPQGSLNVTNDLSKRLINLPSSPQLNMNFNV